jgi:tetratricopeptide (TPR) repeat protein
MQHFYHVVDDPSAGRLQPIAFLFLGRLYLEDDQAERAIRPLTRSLARAPDDVSRATATIVLASAHLLLDNPYSANRILMTHRSVAADGPHYDQMALLAALARHQAASTTTQIEKEGWPLLNAVTHLDGGEFFGTYGLVILAEAYQRLGLFGAAESTLLRGLQVVPQGGLRSRMLYALAQHHNDAGNLSECKELLASLAVDGDDAWSDRAKLRLAEVAGAEGDDELCLAICRELLQDASETIERQEVLRTMGRTFERQGSHRAAALCFAGTEPGIPITDRQRTMP